MDSFEFTKIAGAVLSALLIIVGMKTIVDSRQGGHGEEVGYVLPTAAPAPGAPATAEAPKADAAAPAEAPKAEGNAAAPAAPAAAAFDAAAVVKQVATAKPEDGAAVFRKCATCHVSKKDAPSTAGPNLWGVVDRPKASHADFASKYSEAMKTKGGQWSYENLASFLHKPKDYVTGTKMVFAGIADPAELASLIAYLRTLSDSPAALPN